MSIIQVTSGKRKVRGGGGKSRLVLHTSVTGSILYSLGVEVVLDVVRELPHDPDGVEAGDKVFNSQPSRNPR